MRRCLVLRRQKGPTVVEQIELAGLDALVWGSAEPTSEAVAFFHGFGANMQDLYPLAQMMDPGQKFNWYFPNGALDILIAPGFRGRAWYPIDMAKYEKALREGRAREVMYEKRPEGMDQALELMGDFVSQVQERHEKVVIGGFSQGAILSTELCCRLKVSPRACVLMSGSLVDKASLEALLPRRPGLPFIQSHGTNDAILSYDGAKSLNILLQKHGWRGDLLSFPGGHEIPMEVIGRVSQFIHKQLQS